MLDKTVNLVALATAAVGAVVAGLNAANYFADRKAQGQQASFNNAVSLSKLYFDKLAVQSNFCTVRSDANLLVAIITNLNSNAPDPDLQSIALTMNSDFQNRVNANPCPGDNVANLTGQATSSGVIEVQKSDLPPNSVYAIKNQVAANLNVLQQATAQQTTAPQPAAAPSFVIYIQYHGDPTQAQALQAKINQTAGFTAPGIEQVAAVPNANEIRVYRATDIAKAQELLHDLGLDARVVNLGNAFPNLPAGRMEIWLKSS